MKVKVSVYLLAFSLLVGCATSVSPTFTPEPVLPPLSPFPTFTNLPLPGLPTAVTVLPVLQTPSPPGATPTLEPAPAASSPTNLPQPTVCQPPPGWVVYTVQPGDTLYSLGLRTETSAEEIMAANCLASSLILSGQSLYLPYLPPPPTVRPTLVAGIVAPPAVATPVPPGPGDPTLTILPDFGPPGTKFSLLITDFSPNETITISIMTSNGDDIFVVTRIVNEKGNFTEVYTSSPGILSGRYNIYAIGQTKQALGEFVITSTP
jgi:LysM repeat protein